MMKNEERVSRLMPNGIPKYVRIYKRDSDITVVYTGRYRGKGGWFQYLGMNEMPFHPQYGICQHGESQTQIDINKSGFAPAIGRKNHLGVRIKFQDLNADCQKIVIQDYKEIWGLS